VCSELQSREERCSSEPFVTVRHRGGSTPLNRQAGLCAIEGLNLTLLVGAQDHGVIRWIDVEPDDVLKLLDKERIVTELKCRQYAMRLEGVCAPNAADCRRAHVRGLCHAALAPVRLPGRHFLCRLVYDFLNPLG
jgi:hypothetical protein